MSLQMLGYLIWLQIANGDTTCIFSDKPGATTRALESERNETFVTTLFSLFLFLFLSLDYIPSTFSLPSPFITSMKLSVLAFLLVALFAMLAQADLQDEIDQAMKKFCGGNLSHGLLSSTTKVYLQVSSFDRYQGYQTKQEPSFQQPKESQSHCQ